MIWSIAIPGQRAIRLIPRCQSKTAARDDAAGKQTYRLCYGPRGPTDHIPTILLHICKESRTFALSRYKPFLGSPLADLPICFDFQGDTLLFNGDAEWKFMTDLNEEERKAEREKVLRIAAEIEAMMEELRDTDSTSDMADSDVSTDESSDESLEEDQEETGGVGYDDDGDSLLGEGNSASSVVDYSGAHGTEAVDDNVEGNDLSPLFGDSDSTNDDLLAPDSDVDSLFGDDKSSEEADEPLPRPTLYLRGGACSLMEDDESESALDVDEEQVDGAWGPLPIRTLAALGMPRDTLMGLAEPSARIAQLDDQRGEENVSGSDLDSLFGDGQYRNGEGGIPFGGNNDGDWDDLDFLYGSSKTKAHKFKKWKEQLRFIGLSGGTCPNHDTLAPFTAVVKVTVERGSAFGLTALMKDHLLQGFKKGRGVEDFSQVPIVQFVNRIL